jgi:hypothetical protein
MRCICILLDKPWSWVVTVGQLLAPLRKERLSVAGVIVRFPQTLIRSNCGFVAI